jgi:putative FmdB family regulatory protein
MPIYEFYCEDCHAILSFLARTPKPRTRPDCPRCGRPRLERRASAFAVSRGRPEPQPAGAPSEADDQRLERAMAEMAAEAENLNEDDPRQMARMVRRMMQTTGMPLTGPMEEAIRRMEAGEDPDRIEDEMGELLEGDDEALAGVASEARARYKAIGKRLLPPRVDPTLYEL